MTKIFCGYSLLLTILFFVFTKQIVVLGSPLKTNHGYNEILNKSKEQFIKLITEKSDWFLRILEIVKLEKQYRQEIVKCKNETCLYRIPSSDNIEEYSIKRRFKRNLIGDELNFNLSADKEFEQELSILLNDNKSSTKSSRNSNHLLVGSTKKSRKSTSSSVNHSKSEPTDDRPMSECTGIYLHYCKNEGQCAYIVLLREAVCKCKKGFTGKRCMDYSLSDATLTLNSHEHNQVVLQNLVQSELEAFMSVIDATVRYTVNAIEKQKTEVKRIFEGYLPKN